MHFRKKISKKIRKKEIKIRKEKIRII